MSAGSLVVCGVFWADAEFEAAFAAANDAGENELDMEMLMKASFPLSTWKDRHARVIA